MKPVYLTYPEIMCTWNQHWLSEIHLCGVRRGDSVEGRKARDSDTCLYSSSTSDLILSFPLVPCVSLTPWHVAQDDAFLYPVPSDKETEKMN